MTEAEHDYGVTHDPDDRRVVVADHGVNEGMEPEIHVRAVLATGWPVVVLAFLRPASDFLGVLGGDAFRRESVQDSELQFPDAFLDDDTRIVAETVYDLLRRLASAEIRRHEQGVDGAVDARLSHRVIQDCGIERTIEDEMFCHAL